MPIGLTFLPNGSEHALVYEPLSPGEMRSINGFIGYTILAHCQEDDSGGSVCFVEEGYLQNDGSGNIVIPDDWVTEENNYNEIAENGRHSEPMTHSEWAEGEFILVHKRTNLN